MGRNCGDIALNGGVAGGANGILIPEVEWKIEDLEDIIRSRRVRGKNYDVIVVSEGVGNVHDIAKELQDRNPDLDVKSVTLGHVQRGGAPSAADRLLATKLGIAAVDIIEKGEEAGVMLGLEKTDVVSHKLSYAWENYAKKNQENYDVAMMLSV